VPEETFSVSDVAIVRQAFKLEMERFPEGEPARAVRSEVFQRVLQLMFLKLEPRGLEVLDQ